MREHYSNTVLRQLPFLFLMTTSDSGANSMLTIIDLEGLLVILFCPIYVFTCKRWERTQVLSGSSDWSKVKSVPSFLTCGVPQGRALGLILFILYTQPLSDVCLCLCSCLCVGRGRTHMCAIVCVCVLLCVCVCDEMHGLCIFVRCPRLFQDGVPNDLLKVLMT